MAIWASITLGFCIFYNRNKLKPHGIVVAFWSCENLLGKLLVLYFLAVFFGMFTIIANNYSFPIVERTNILILDILMFTI